MTRNRLIALVAVLVIVAAAALLLLGRPGQGVANADQAETAVTATITIAPVKSERLQDVIAAYGLVQADPMASRTLSASRALIVERVLVRPGQTVSAGQPLAEVANASASDLAYRQAADAAAFAKADLARTQRLFDERLAASDQLAQARKASADADAALAAQQKQDAEHARQTLTAGEPVVVVSIAVAAGDHVAQDAPLMVLARTGALSAKLGVEPGAGPVAAGDAVTLRPTAGGAPIASQLTLVGHATDAATRMVDAVAPLPGATMPVGAALEGDIVTGSHEGLTVPRAAVVFDETGAHVFVVAGGKVERAFVNAGRNYGDEIEVSGPIKPGQLVAVQGAYELEDGMAVKVAAQ